MRTHILLTSMAVGAAAAAAVVLAATASGGQPRLTRVVGCIQEAGYRTTAPVHDSGRRSLAGQDPDVQVLLGGSDDVVKVREPSDSFTVVDRTATAIADIRVPRTGAITLMPDGRIPSRTRSVVQRCLAPG
jgi:hypothetical protein